VKGEWTSYESAASSHDNLAVPSIFAPPARDLVALLEVRGVSTILDVGAGTGVASRMAAESAPGALVVAFDPAEGMLRVARNYGLRAVRGAVPGLPFRSESFDRVMGSFVLNHVGPCNEAVRDMIRVLRPVGRLGVTTWGPLENEFREHWQEVAAAAVGEEALDRAVKEALPWEERFTESAVFEGVLRGAGLLDVDLHYRRYEVRTTIAEFLAIREDSIYGRFVRRSLDDRAWVEFKSRLESGFHERFRDPLVYERDVHIGIGRR
jgi:SAM-dependent methyltransferase